MSKGARPKKIPMRKCIVSQEMHPKKDLVRIVKTKDNEVLLDPSGRQNGRGAYITLDPAVAKKAKETRAFDSAFGIKVPDEFYDELYDYVDHQKARQDLL